MGAQFTVIHYFVRCEVGPDITMPSKINFFSRSTYCENINNVLDPMFGTERKRNLDRKFDF